MKKVWIIIGLFIVFAVSCKSKSASVIPIKEMKFIMWDMLSADSWYTELSAKDTMARIRKENLNLYQKVFDIHKTDKEQFYASYRYYSSHPDEMKILMDSVNAYGTRLRDSITKANMPKPVPAVAAKPTDTLKAIRPVADTSKNVKKTDTLKPVMPAINNPRVFKKGFIKKQV